MSCSTEFTTGEYPFEASALERRLGDGSLGLETPGIAMSPGGRRPGKGNARDDIIRAARETFAAEGYDGTSLRAVARAAGVDAALVHHYFDGKADLFMAAMALPFDPRQVQLDRRRHPVRVSTLPGAAVVEGFLTMWDLAEGTGSSFVSCVGAMAASPAVADAMREFVRARVWQHITPTRRARARRPPTPAGPWWRRS